MTTPDIQNLKTFDPFAEADDDSSEIKGQTQDYIHIRIQRTFPPSPTCLLRAHILSQSFASQESSPPPPLTTRKLTETQQNAMAERP